MNGFLGYVEGETLMMCAQRETNGTKVVLVYADAYVTHLSATI